MIRKLIKHKVGLIITVIVVFVILTDKAFFDASSILQETFGQTARSIDVEANIRNDLAKVNRYGDKTPQSTPVDALGVTSTQWPPNVLAKPVVAPPLAWPYDVPRPTGDFPDTGPSLPEVFHYLPHLKRNPSLLHPAIALSKGRTNVSIVVGIPSIRRPVGTYLYDTLDSLLGGLSPAEAADTLIMVCLTEPWNMTYVKEVKEQLQLRYPTQLEQGLLELIVPKPGFYPDLDNLPQTLEDDPVRIKWRTKQNLDYSYLMMHAWTRGQYYVQLEDDVKATQGYITSMKKAIATNRGDWFILEFSMLGFIGRLFRASSVPTMVDFFMMFHAQKPCDWLMEDFFKLWMCGHGEKAVKCRYKINTSVSRPIRPSLFQHFGLRSSLFGTVNKLKDKHFEEDAGAILSNPLVSDIYTSLKSKQNDIYNAYMGDKVFWAATPQEGDIIELIFKTPVTLERIAIKTGNEKHPNGILSDAVVEVLRASSLSGPSPSADRLIELSSHVNRTVLEKAWLQRSKLVPGLKAWAQNASLCETAFVQVGRFNSLGEADISFPPDGNSGALWSLRVRVVATSPDRSTSKDVNHGCIINKIKLTVAGEQ